MRIAEFIGRPASDLLNVEPFKYWPAERTVDEDSDPPEVRYNFENAGIEFICERDGECIVAILILSETHDGVVLSDLPFSLRRSEVLERFGSPTKRGKKSTDPILGSSGPWDRFEGTQNTLHIQYRIDRDEIEMVTVMRNDVVP